MNLDINDLDVTNLARWPAAAKAVVILFLMGGVIFLGYWFHTKDQLAELAVAEEKEVGLKVIFKPMKNSLRKCANLLVPCCDNCRTKQKLPTYW